MKTIARGQSPSILRKAARNFPALARAKTRWRAMWGAEPLADAWGARGQTLHRYYLERFLESQGDGIRGRCLEFQDDSYTSRFGKSRVVSVDILNREPERRAASTFIADLTMDNDLPSDHFDCIICTYVLHIIYEKERVASEMHRLLKPGGVLLVSVPNITVHYPRYPELWRFTTEGLRKLIGQSFGIANVQVTGFGNSLTAAGELRGLSVRDFTAEELRHQDERFSVVVCARAEKR